MVLSFVENNFGEGHGAEKPIDFEEWVNTEKAENSFNFDITGATESDLIIYIGPSGPDAWAEVGAAYGAGVPIFGLHAKGEQIGLMRRMVSWFNDYKWLLDEIEEKQHLLVHGEE